MQTADILLRLQDIDLEILRSEKTLEDLPQRTRILEIRAKRDEVAQKGAQVAEMQTAADSQMACLCEEDAQQEARLAELQDVIRSTQDYRVIASLTRDLEGCGKRREKIAFELNTLEGKTIKIHAVADQVTATIKKLEQQEAQVTKDFIAVGGKLKESIQRLRSDHDALIAQLDVKLRDDYESLSRKKGGIAVSVFDGSHCSVCRVELPEGQVHELRTGPVVSICPNCHRIIIIQPAEDAQR
jgi:uncharacterized protein